MQSHFLDKYHCDPPHTKGAWFRYRHKLIQQFNIKVSDTIKVHISLDQSDPNKFNLACKIIAERLAEANVANFKMIWEPNTQRTSNTFGKEVTIYLQKNVRHRAFRQEGSRKFWLNLFAKIENDLLSIEITPNQAKVAGLGDHPFPGSKGFIFYRNPRNALKRYISAHDLAPCGFTRHEAFSIGKNSIAEWFKEEMEEEKKPASMQKADLTKYKTSPWTEESSRLCETEFYPKFQSCLTESFNSARNVFSGDSKRKRSRRNELTLAFFLHMFGLHGSTESKETTISAHHRLLLSTLFDRCLYHASAVYMTMVQALLTVHGKSSLANLGNIVPVLYHHVFKPVIEAWKKDPTLPLSGIISIPTFIEHLAKAGFRKRFEGSFSRDKEHAIHFTQTMHDHPQYVLGLTQNDIDQLFSLALPFAPPLALPSEKELADLSLKNVCGIHSCHPKPRKRAQRQPIPSEIVFGAAETGLLLFEKEKSKKVEAQQADLSLEKKHTM